MLACGVGFVSFKVGRRWRRELKGAHALRAHLESEAAAAAQLRAQVSASAHGNVVEVNVGDRSADGDVGSAGAVARGELGLWIPSPVRHRSGGRFDLRAELTSGDDIGVSESVGLVGGAEPDSEFAEGDRAGLRPLDGGRFWDSRRQGK